MFSEHPIHILLLDINRHVYYCKRADAIKFFIKITGKFFITNVRITYKHYNVGVIKRVRK